MIAAGPSHALAYSPLRYQAREWRGNSLLAYDETGGRIVEALGDVATADHVVVVVPGNDNYLSNYFDPRRPTRPRDSGLTILRTMRALAPEEASAVVVWVGYDTPRSLSEAAYRFYAERGAQDLVRLTYLLPRAAHITLVGHSYGSVVCGLALGRGRVDDCVALGSPGMGGRSAVDLDYSGNLWVAFGPTDWIRLFPRWYTRDRGHGPAPTRRGYGATAFATGPVHGHCGYYTEDSESVRNIARIGLGRYARVTRPGTLSRQSWRAPAPVTEAAP